MNPDFEPYRTPEPTPLTPEQQTLLKDFRAYLHLVMTAGQTGQKAKLAGLPGPKLDGYCLAMAKLPDNQLAKELAKAVCPVAEAVYQVMEACTAALSKEANDSARKAELEALLWQLDFSYYCILNRIKPLVSWRAEVSNCQELILDVLFSRIGRGDEAAALARQYQQRFPGKEGEYYDDNVMAYFAYQVYRQVAVLDPLAKEFPELMRSATRGMNAWPMLLYRYNRKPGKFEEMADLLQLGRDYPLDVGKGAKHHPDTPMVIYLDGLLCELHRVWSVTRAESYASQEKEDERLGDLWREYPDPMPNEKILELLRLARRLPALTKETSEQWSKTVVVPLILETDAQDWKACRRPALKQIAGQRDVKSRATFKSRLLSSVSKTLKSLARAGK